jgi:hypothetical protein
MGMGVHSCRVQFRQLRTCLQECPAAASVIVVHALVLGPRFCSLLVTGSQAWWCTKHTYDVRRLWAAEWQQRSLPSVPVTVSNAESS